MYWRQMYLFFDIVSDYFVLCYTCTKKSSDLETNGQLLVGGVTASQSKTNKSDKIQKQAGTELGKAQPKLGLGKIVAKSHNFGQ